MVRRLLVLNGIAIFGVVLIHAAGWGLVAMFAWQDQYATSSSIAVDQAGGLGYFYLRAVEQIAVFVIPAFLFVSGFFIAAATGRSQKNVKWSVIRSRIKFLVIPYLIWSTVLLVLLAVEDQLPAAPQKHQPVAYARNCTGGFLQFEGPLTTLEIRRVVPTSVGQPKEDTPGYPLRNTVCQPIRALLGLS